MVFLTCQFAINFSKPVMGPENLFSEINLALEGLFEDYPIINPVPFIGNNQGLLDVPVVEAIAKDSKGYELKIARGRLDFYRNAIAGEDGYDVFHDEFITKIESLLEVIKNKSSVGWIGFVNNYIYTTTDKNISKKILNERLLNLNEGETNSFLVKHANRIKVGEIESNNELTFGLGKASINGAEPIDGLIITQDFNTKPSTNSIDFAFCKTYIDEAKPLIKINEIINLISN